MGLKISGPSSAALSATFAGGATLPASNGTDDLADLNAFLTTHAGKTIHGKRGQNYLISGPILLPAETHLDMTGCTVTLLPGSNTSLLRNVAALGAGARDTHVSVTGGTWDRGANVGGAAGDTRHSVILHRCDGVQIRDMRFKSTDGKYAVLLADVTAYTARDLHFEDTASDGIHVIGPASDGLISGMFGTTGDDMVSITPRDYAEYELTAGGGHVSDLVIENIFPDGTKAGVKLLGGDPTTSCTNVTIRNVYGWTDTAHAVVCVDDTGRAETTGGLIDAVSIENVAVQTPSTFCTLSIGGQNIGTIRARNITCPGNTGTLLRTTGTIKRIDLDGVTATGLHAGRIIELLSATTIDTLSLSRARIEMKADESAGYFVHQSGTAQQIILDDVHTKGGIAAVAVNGTVTQMDVRKARIAGQYGIYVTGAAASLDVTFDDVVLDAALALYMLGAGSSAILRGGGVRGGTLFNRSSTQSVRIISPMLQGDLSKMAQANGDMVYNNNAGLAIGVGVAVSNGSTWKNLHSGLTYP